MRFGGLSADSRGTADDRPPLVFLHGLSYDRRQWGPVLNELATVEGDRRALALDLPGHGGSPRRDSYRLDEVVGVLHQAVTEAGLDAPIVVGHSLGGVLATIYAATYPARGVVNVDQPLLVGGFGEVLRRAEPVLRSPAYGEVWNSMLARMHIDLLPPEARELVRTATTPRQDLLLGYWHEVMTESAADLGERRARDLEVIHSRGIAYDYVTGGEPDPAYRHWLESALPDVAVTVLPGSGHFPHLAHPAEFTRILTG
ncbi:alpha/beta fold hydrolase [Planotetraspora phitsanulokensis]|uniref:Alpha/beta hydrolase n=1 Tax=Planotetraspora phitsanulokensis TaxID=575192 RepID=A0A8J3U494_9ACTN|nr:alpha/beta hydrolase [Planotetraspora phitsanulokensis]GII37930.1 alpha/beta hydrolase [Planotetraspora phitsanulokensis]